MTKKKFKNTLFCDTPNCCRDAEVLQVLVSESKACDSFRNLCSPCESAFSSGFQHSSLMTGELINMPSHKLEILLRKIGVNFTSVPGGVVLRRFTNEPVNDIRALLTKKSHGKTKNQRNRSRA